jgi:hypothetical protein
MRSKRRDEIVKSATPNKSLLKIELVQAELPLGL